MGTTTRSGRRACVKFAVLALFGAAITTFALAESLPNQGQATVSERYPASSIRSILDADAALADMARERAEIEARYLADEQACHTKFFATSCIEQAKDRRRNALSKLRPVEIEANAFKRQARVSERDAVLAERIESADRERQERTSRVTTSPHADSAAGKQEEEPSKKVQATLFSERSEQHEAKMTRRQVDDAVTAEKRAENIAAYEKKKRDALARQQKVAQRKAEKALKRETRQGEDGKPD